MSHAKILDHYHNFLFFINITHLKDNVDQINIIFNNLQKEQELPRRLLHQLKLNLDQIEQILQKFLNRKVRRGLANFIGKGIKFITGNLDDDDLKTINENLENLYNSKSSEIERINKLTSFANHLSQRYSEDLTLLNENIIHTKELFQKIQSIEGFQIILESQILQSQTLLNTLLILERTISFAMNEIPNLEIIKVEELISIRTYLEKIYKTQQLSPIDHVHLFKIIEFAKISVIGTEETINFLLKIPILKQVIASYSRIYPVPNIQDIAVIPPRTYSIKINNEEYWTNEKCKSALGSSTVLCLQPPAKEACILSNPARCQTTLVNNDFNIIHPLKNHQLLTLFKNYQNVLEDCNGILLKKSIKGINLLSSACKIIIDESIYDETVPIFEITVKNISNISLNSTHKVDFHLRHLKEPTSILQEAEKLSDQPMYLHPTTQIIHQSTSVILFCLTILGIIFVIRNKRRISELIYSPRKIIHVEMENINQGHQEDNRDVIS